MNYAYIVLFLLTGIFVFLWIWATQKELDLLFNWLDPKRYVPPSSIKETLLIVWFGIVLSALLFAARDPLLYGVIFSVYSIILIPASIYLTKEITKAIEYSNSRIEDDMASSELEKKTKLYRAGVDVLKEYFLDRPVIRRLLAISTASITGVLVAIYWKISGSKTAGVTAYSVFLVTIAVSEIVIARWRCIREDRIRAIEAEFEECIRGKEEPQPNQDKDFN